MTYESEHCFECVNVRKCYRAFYSSDSEDSYDIYFSKNLVGCSNCFGCTNLRKQQYCIYNEQYSKEDYEKRINELLVSAYNDIPATIKKSQRQFI